MQHYKHLAISILLAVNTLAISASVIADDLINPSNNVFNFQQKLANKGNTLAQYKLATMYEFGEGVKQDTNLALQWYNRAAQSGMKKAEQRQMYLQIRQNGFDEQLHTEWLNKLHSDASKGDVEASYLLSQMYRHGIGVNKDDRKALSILQNVYTLDNEHIGNEIASIEKQMQIQKQKQKQLETQRIAKITEQQKSRQLQKTMQRQAALKQKKAEQIQLEKAEKKRRYEAVMKQLQREQEMINAQQAEVTGEAISALDDEI